MSSLQTPAEKTFLNLYFQVHQPRRLRHVGFFDIGKGLSVFDDERNREIIERVAANCYLPANQMLLKLIRRYNQVRATFSISGTALEQLERYAPDVVESFKELASTGAVEFLAETYYHSLASVSDPENFVSQVQQHVRAIERCFGVRPRVFRNTELIYSDEVGRQVSRMGFQGVFADGIVKILHHRSPDHLYEHLDGNGLKLFLRNYSLSDDIAFRFPNRKWKEWPLTPEKFTRWLLNHRSRQRLVTLGLDYETFGEHQKRSSGIFAFMKNLLTHLASSAAVRMVTPSEAISILEPQARLSSPDFISWADKERDLSAWLGNDLQKDAFATMKTLGRKIAALGDDSLIATWNDLQTSDHFYYMSTKKGDDGDVHNYFSPYASPYEAFINYMNVLSDINLQLRDRRRELLMLRKPATARSNKRLPVT